MKSEVGKGTCFSVTKFKEHTRIAHYSGLPELMSMFKQIADIRTSDTLKLDVPECEYKVVNVDPTIDNTLKITSDVRNEH